MSHRLSRRLIITAVVLCILIAGFILALPEVVRRLAVNRLQGIFNEPVSIANVDVNLFTGRAAVDHLMIGKADATPMLKLPSVKIDFSRKSLLSGTFNFQKIVLKHPQLLLERFAPGKYNVLSAMAKSKSNSRSAGFSIGHLEVGHGQVTFVDHVQKPVYRTTFSSLDISAGPISTLPNATITPTDFTLGVQVANGVVKLSGSATPFQSNLNAHIKLSVKNVQLARFQTYLPYSGRFDLKNSSLNGEAQYVLTHSNGKIAKQTIEGNVGLTKVALLTASGSPPIAQLGAVQAQQIHVNLISDQAQIGSLVIDHPNLRIERDAAGFNFDQLMPQTKTEKASARARKDTGGGFSFALKRFQAEGGSIQFVDQTVTPTVNATLRNFDLVANETELSPSFSVGHIDAKAAIGDGTLQLTGALHGTPLQGNLSVNGENVPFQPFTSYVDQLFHAANASGESLDAKLTIAFKPEDNKGVTASVTGQVVGKDMGLAFSNDQNRIFQTKQLGLKLNTVQLASPIQVDIDRIWLSGAKLQIVRTKDSKLNLARLWTESKHPGSTPASSEKQPSKTVLKIGSIGVDRSEIAIVDRTVSPHYRTTISQVSAKLADLLPGAKRADISVKGVLGNNSNLALNGWFTPFSAKPYIDLQGTIKSYALPRLNPYATEYVDHRIRQGQVTTDVKYTLNGDKLQAKAQIVLQDVHVGEKTGDAFKNRIGIPLSLAVALLQDASGTIHLQVDVSGGTGPHVNIRELVWAAVRNAIVKAVTAPFRLVGKIFTFGGKIGRLKIEPILFEPGTATIAAGNNKQLVDLAELLREKPRVQLELQGQTSQQDSDAIKKKKFWDMLQTVNGKDYETALVGLYKQLGGTTNPPTPLPAATETILEKFVLDHIQVSSADLQNLARERAVNIKDKLHRLAVDGARLTVSAPDETRAQEPAVEFHLMS